MAGPFHVEASEGGARPQRRWINAGEVGVTPAGLSVFRAFKGRPDVVLVHLDPDRLRQIAEDAFGADPARVCLIPRLAEPDETADRYMRLLLCEAEAPTPGAELMVDALACALMVHLLRRHSCLSPPPHQSCAAIAPGRVRHVTEFMRARLDENLSLAQLAGVAGLSPAHFTRAFRSATGRSPHQFFISLRIEHARTLLESTNLPVIAVGLQCGFVQPSHFAATFRKATGLTPRDWRLAQRG